MSVDEELFRENLTRLQSSLGYTFRNPLLLVQALTHRSFTNEALDPQQDNERMEFLGDSVLELLVSERLYHAFPQLREGDLSRARAAMVKATSLARTARHLGVGPVIRLGRGEEQTGGRAKDSLLADTLEAILGAIYLDGGMAAAILVVQEQLDRSMSGEVDRLTRRDPKGELQEWVQERRGITPRYQVLETAGPDHGPSFRVAVTIESVELAQGSGRSKKEATAQAARSALEGLQKGELLLPEPTTQTEP